MGNAKPEWVGRQFILCNTVDADEGHKAAAALSHNKIAAATRLSRRTVIKMHRAAGESRTHCNHKARRMAQRKCQPNCRGIFIARASGGRA